MNLYEELKNQEQVRIRYWRERDYFLPLRLKWRAQMVRHLFHLFPGETILELGCAAGEWTREVSAANHDTNPIHAATLDPSCFEDLQNSGLSKNIEPLLLQDFPGPLKDRQYDFIIGWHLMNDRTCGLFLKEIKKLLKPGGGLLLFEPNPWNPYRGLRRFFSRLAGFFRSQKRESDSINRVDLFAILSEVGFVRIQILPYDFLYPPVPKFLLWPMQNLSLVFENTPYLRNFAGSLYLWAQNPPPEGWKRPLKSLACHDRFKSRVSVLVPCRNEEDNIPPLVDGLIACYGDYLREVILVDDNSTDGTAEVGEELSRRDARVRVIRRPMPNGVGRALRDGFAAVRGDYVLTLDCDFQHILPEINGLFDAVEEGADVAIGSRFSRNSVLLNYAFTKILANRGFHVVANLLLRIQFRDVTNNLKLMKRDVMDRLHLESDDFAANAETGLQPILLGYNVREVPISWINRSVDMGFSSFNLMKTGPNYFRVLFRLLRRKWSGRPAVLQPSGK